jgi:hypothetical protein
MPDVHNMHEVHNVHFRIFQNPHSCTHFCLITDVQYFTIRFSFLHCRLFVRRRELMHMAAYCGIEQNCKPTTVALRAQTKASDDTSELLGLSFCRIAPAL